jgi:crossover junction endodeoxyribonuclease RuvC
MKNCERVHSTFEIRHSKFLIHNLIMRILGVDPGSITTGFGVVDFERGRFLLVEQGSISTPRGAELPERLVRIHRAVVEIIGRTSPEAIAVETPFAGHNAKSLIQLSHARGVILLAAQESRLTIYEYSPRSVKSAVVGYGGAEKEQVAKMVRVLLPACAAIKMTIDASDALAIAICHAHTAGTIARLKIRA